MLDHHEGWRWRKVGGTVLMRGAGVLTLIIEFLSRRTGQSENKDSKILTLQSLKRYQTLIADLWFQEGKFE